MLSPLNYTKLWTVSEDTPYFPTLETDETQVREDMQYLFDEIRSYINNVLIAEIQRLEARVAELEKG